MAKEDTEELVTQPDQVNEDNISEITFPEENVSETDREHQETMSNVGGGMMMTWGTGNQKGLKLGPETPRNGWVAQD